jgi:hypothetical protein
VLQKEATADWQPPEPSPLIGVVAPRLRELLRQSRRRS